ncbi:hypothetical protein E4T56_gene6275 [Termitomyces sp. T112]|nr:hypothetical protein E4T56_gene6275 [Termitomyces sp. T112]
MSASSTPLPSDGDHVDMWVGYKGQQREANCQQDHEVVSSGGRPLGSFIWEWGSSTVSSRISPSVIVKAKPQARGGVSGSRDSQSFTSGSDTRACQAEALCALCTQWGE